MSFHCQMSFDDYPSSIRKDILERSLEIIEEDEFAQAKFEVVNKFYAGDISWSTAEAMAKLWAKSLLITQWKDEDAMVIATKMDLDDKDMYAVLDDRNGFKKSNKNQKFWSV